MIALLSLLSTTVSSNKYLHTVLVSLSMFVLDMDFGSTARSPNVHECSGHIHLLIMTSEALKQMSFKSLQSYGTNI